MEITRGDERDVIRLELRGRLDELAAHDAEKTFLEVMRDNPGKLLLDLSGVEYVSSSGLRVLLMLSKAMQKQQGALKLCGLTPFVAEVFEISNFTRMFDIHADAEAAMTSFENG